MKRLAAINMVYEQFAAMSPKKKQFRPHFLSWLKTRIFPPEKQSEPYKIPPQLKNQSFKWQRHDHVLLDLDALFVGIAQHEFGCPFWKDHRRNGY